MPSKLNYKKLAYIDPWRVFIQVLDKPGVVFLQSKIYHKNYGRYSFIMFDPVATYFPDRLISGDLTNQANVPYALSQSNSTQNAIFHWQRVIADNKIIHNSELPPFTGGLAGYFSYDLGKRFESIQSNTTSNIPDYCLGLYNKVLAFDHLANATYALVHEIHGIDLDYTKHMDDLVMLYTNAQSATTTNTANAKTTEYDLPKLASNFTQDEYVNMVRKAKKHIVEGDIYEVNLAQHWSCDLPESYLVGELYNRLSQINGTPFLAYLDLDLMPSTRVTDKNLDKIPHKLKILSASPERFLSIHGNRIEARPIKGTIKRSDDTKMDQKLAQILSLNEKDRAENIMIVDLLRNDLGKICLPGSIKVDKLCGIESFANLHHLVSVISGELKSEIMVSEVIQAVFPGGSITGAPKIRAMQIIEELEKVRRGIYCGSIGYLGFNGNTDLSIAIRTIVIEEDALGKKHLSFSSGGAITLDSDPLLEYEETLLKAEKLIDAINGKVSK